MITTQSLAVFLGLVFTNCVLIWRKFTCWMIFTSKCQTTWVIVWLMWKKIVTRFSYTLIIIPSFGLFPRNAWHYDPSCADSAFLEAWIYNKQVVYLYISIWLELERCHLGFVWRKNLGWKDSCVIKLMAYEWKEWISLPIAHCSYFYNLVPRAFSLFFFHQTRQLFLPQPMEKAMGTRLSSYLMKRY